MYLVSIHTRRHKYMSNGQLIAPAERQFVRGVKALQKLAVPDGRILDFQEAKNRVEKMTADVRGQDRLEAMRRWIEVGLQKARNCIRLHASNLTCIFPRYSSSHRA